MGETAGGSDVVAVTVPGGLAVFGDATCAARDLDSHALAAAAADAVARLVGRPVPALFARQEHTRLAFSFSAADGLPPGPHLVGTCDALLTAERFTALTVRTADCLPVALAGGGVVAMVHAGWRGLAADLLGAVVERMRSEYGVGTDGVHAVIGVGIGPCHYPVGEEVFAALARPRVAGEEWRADGAVDLARWARGRLIGLGVRADAVRVLPGCTACLPSYHSYRRDGGLAGRQWSAVVLT